MIPSALHLEPRLTEDSFRRYEPFITSAVANWPTETSIVVDSNIVAPTTYVARCRDAISSYRKFDWPSTINRSKFVSIDGQFRISLEPNGSVWFRARAYQGRPAGKIVANAIPVTATTNTVRGSLGPWEAKTTTDTVLHAFCTLLHTKHLQVPVLFSGQFPQATVDQLESAFDVAFNYDPNRHETVLL